MVPSISMCAVAALQVVVTVLILGLSIDVAPVFTNGLPVPVQPGNRDGPVASSASACVPSSFYFCHPFTRERILLSLIDNKTVFYDSLVNNISNPNESKRRFVLPTNDNSIRRASIHHSVNTTSLWLTTRTYTDSWVPSIFHVKPNVVGNVQLEIVLIELSRRPHPRFLSTVYNIAHLYGGQHYALTIIYARAQSKLIDILLKQRFSNFRAILIDKRMRYPEDYNAMATSSWLYELFVGRTEFILIVQTDVMMVRKVDHELFAYDIVAAPWPRPIKNSGIIGNGGYSLRRVNKMIKALQLTNNAADRNKMPEDVWWSTREREGVVYPGLDVAVKFAVERSLSGGIIPSGVHQLYLMTYFEESGLFLNAYLAMQEQNSIAMIDHQDHDSSMFTLPMEVIAIPVFVLLILVTVVVLYAIRKSNAMTQFCCSTNISVFTLKSKSSVV